MGWSLYFWKRMLYFAIGFFRRRRGGPKYWVHPLKGGIKPIYFPPYFGKQGKGPKTPMPVPLAPPGPLLGD
jgi:hypothetical protein